MASLISATLLTLLFIISNANAHQKHGFTVELIHRDSPKSPLYNPAETHAQRTRNAIKRSLTNTALRFNSSPNSSAQSVIRSNKGEYLMNISIGTPPFPILAIADTGSDLIWTQCKPCVNCYHQKAPLFAPNESSTYKKVSCSSSQCHSLDDSSCSTVENNTCSYTIVYGDKSYTKGDVAIDTVTLGKSSDHHHRRVSFKNVIIGCGHDNVGIFNEMDSGIIGLGGGHVSLVSQLGIGKFSYCLVPLTAQTDLTSTINFGTKAVVKGHGVVSTPLVKKEPDTYYFLTLEAITVGSKKLPFHGSILGTGEGNMIIDSGTTLTLLPSVFYSEMESAVASLIKAERVKDPKIALKLCYSVKSNIVVPDITIHFKGADVKLDKVNTFVLVTEDLYCFAFAAYDQLPIYGNLAQMNFLVGYDTVSGTVSFKMSDCTKL